MDNINYEKIQMEYNSINIRVYKLEAIRKAIQLADEEKDYDWQLIFREDFINEAFNENGIEALIMFPEFISIFDNNYNKLTSFSPFSMLWVYKWILTDVGDYYQISKEKAIEYFEDFKKRCQQYGYSLRQYYYFLSFYIEQLNKEEYNNMKYKYLDYEKDTLDNNCKECDMKDEFIYILKEKNNFDEAIKKVKTLLDNPKKCKCKIALKDIYMQLLEYYLKNKDIDNCKLYEELLYNQNLLSVDDIVYIKLILEYCAGYDINKGIRRYKEYLKLDLRCKNPKYNFDFGIGAYKLFKSIKQKTNKNTIKLLLNKNFPLYKEDGVYIIDEIINYYEKKLTDLAIKFDKRNSNNYLIKELEEAKDFKYFC